MIKIYLKKQLEELKRYPIEVINSIFKTIEILDDNYGANRSEDNDLGGYVLIAENIVDIEELKRGILRDVVAEYTDIIQGSGEVNYTSSLFLLSSDYAVVVVTTEELSKLLLQ